MNGLAQVALTLPSVQRIYDHLVSHKPHCRNMHLREACQRNGKRDLRYLHAMYAIPDRIEIEGMISGPGLFWHYRIIGTGSATRIRVFDEDAPAKAVDRLIKRFLIE